MNKKKLICFISILIAAALTLAIAILYRNSTFTFNNKSINQINESKNSLIKDVYTDKSAYKPAEEVKYYVELTNIMKKSASYNLRINFKHLNKTMESKTMKVALKAYENKTLKLSWQPPAEDFTGYMVEIFAEKGFKIIDHRNTGIDVSSNWTKFPRYGYIASFSQQNKEKSKSIIEDLNKLHINGLEFYDWQYKHNQPLAGTVDNPEKTWPDIANRETCGQTVKDYIDLAHGKNMMAANYNLMFGAFENYEKTGIKKEWGLYKDEKHEIQDYHPLPNSWATSSLYIMNPDNKEWQQYILQKEKEAMQIYNFDVFHVDTLGPRGTLYDYYGKEINLQDTYADFLINAKKYLNKNIVINTVNEYGKAQVAKNADVDFLYTEVWPPSYKAYEFLKRTVDNDINLSDGKKSSVIAAYMNNSNSNITGEFNESSVRLTDAVIFASGGSHIELGDTGMLSSEYFPSSRIGMTDSLKRAMRNYYDFLVGYENILRDGLKNVNAVIEAPGIKLSDDGSENTVWAFSRENEKYQTISLINLLNRDDNSWRDDEASCAMPQVKKDFVVKLYTSITKIKSINLATPDLNEASSIKLKYSSKEDSKGKYLEIKIPELQYFDTIYIEK